MSANVDQNTRPDYGQVLQDIADGGRRGTQRGALRASVRHLAGRR